eukprot:scaffold110497_cov18-Phaeocystis_antarctica.AAC.1
MVPSSSATLALSSLSSVLYLILIGRAAPAGPPRVAGFSNISSVPESNFTLIGALKVPLTSMMMPLRSRW